MSSRDYGELTRALRDPLGNGLLGVAGAPLFNQTEIQSINGGNFYNVQRDAVFNTVNNIQIQSHPRPADVNIDDLIEETILRLEKFATVEADFRRIHQVIMDSKAQRTGDAFRATEQVTGWSERKKKTLWIRGGPGTGKTYLAGSFIQSLEAEARESPKGDAAVIYAYLRYTEKLGKYDIVLDLIIQLIDQSRDIPAIATMVQAFLKRYRRPRDRPLFDDLVQLLKSIITQFARVGVVIDGIDESLEENRWVIVEIVSSLDAQVLFTSRPLPSLEAKLQKLHGEQVSFVDFVAQSEDLDLYIASILDQAPGLAELLEVHGAKEEIIRLIKEKADGMFLHAALQVDLLQSCRSLHDVYEAIKQFPARIDDLYARTLERIPAADIPLVHSVLLWLLHVRGNVTIADLQHALAVSPTTYQFDHRRVVSEANLISVCRGLITIEHLSMHVRLIHYTAHEALLQILANRIHPGHEVIVKTSIACLADCGFQESTLQTLGELDEAFDNRPLLRYSFQNVSYHIQCANRLTPSATFLPFLESFVRQCRAFPYLSAVEQLFSPSVDLHHLAPIHVAAHLGIPSLILELVTQGVDVNLPTVHPSGRGRTSLMIAAMEGQEDVLELLLSTDGIDVDAADHNEDSPLFGASYAGCEQIVKRLLELPGVNINHQNSHGYSAMILAAHYGRANVVAFLLDIPGVDPGLVDNEGRSAFAIAAWRGFDDIVQMLLKTPNLDVNQVTNRQISPLLLAAHVGHLDVIETLLKVPGINVHHRNLDGDSALSLASSAGRTAIVKTLLGITGVDVNGVNNAGRSPLALAAEWGHDAVVRVFIDTPGVDLNKPDNDGLPPLLLASRFDHPSVVRALVETPGVDIYAIANDGYSALGMAAAAASERAAKVLLELPDVDKLITHPPDGFSVLACTTINGNVPLTSMLLDLPGMHPNQQEYNQSSPWLYSALCNREGVVRKFLEVDGLDVNQADEEGFTALGLACAGKYDAIAKMLLETAGVNIHIRKHDGATPFWFAASSGSEEIVEMFLRMEGVDVNDVGPEGETALARAARAGRSGVVRILLSVPGIDVHKRNNDGQSPLALAARYDHINILRLLLPQPGTDINQVDHMLRSPLHLASMYNSPTAVKELLGMEGIEVNEVDVDGYTPLALAAVQGRAEIVPLLLEFPGIDPHKVNKEGRTPFALAAEYGNSDDVITILSQVPGTDINQTGGDNDSSPLLLATIFGNHSAVRLLLGMDDIKIHQVNGQGLAAVPIAIIKGHLEVFKVLVDVLGDKIHQFEFQGRSPFALAAQYARDEMLQILLNVPGTDINKFAPHDRLSPLLLAAVCGHQSTLQFLVGLEGIDLQHVDSDGDSALTLAAREGYEELVKILVGVPGVDVNHVNDGGNSALALAARYGYAGVVKILLATPGACPHFCNKQGSTVIGLAAEYGHDAVVEALQDVPDIPLHQVDGGYRTPVQLAATYGHESTVRLLLSFDGVDQGAMATSCLTLAAMGGHTSLVEFLLGVPGVNPNVANSSALFLASAFGHSGVVQLLLDFPGINMNDLTNEGECSPLMRAAYWGRTSIIPLLLQHPSIDVTLTNRNGESILHYILSYHLYKYHDAGDPVQDAYDPQPVTLSLLDHPEIQGLAHQPDAFGWTALMRAGMFGYVEVVKRLLEIPGCGLEARTSDGQTAVEIALEAGQVKVVEMLRNVQ